VVIDLRYVVGWHVSTLEDAMPAKELIDDAIAGARPEVLSRRPRYVDDP